MYKAIADFKDLQDNGYIYRAGDIFPRTGYAPTGKRLADLLSGNNKRGRAVIVAVAESPKEVEETPAEVQTETLAEKKPRRGRKPKNQ